MEHLEQITPQKKYYLTHKDEPLYIMKMREYRRRYYQKNKKIQSEKSLDYYYAKLAENTLNELPILP